jgi:methionyl-tRNA formyltransferase
MIQGKHWTALFSHTGTEIIKISNRIGRSPDVIVTNKPPGDGDIHKNITETVYVPDRPSVVDYRNILQNDTVVTLHGWMRIIPPAICDEYEIYNLHPGLITKYPELKGADPQKRVAETTDPEYSHIGCVIHRVTPGVDEGPVLAEASTLNVYSGEDMISCRLHDMATELWLDILNPK